jgi:L-iditol 2-dehydrogenase
MKQAVMVSPGKIEYREADVPSHGSSELLIKIRRIGICGSDIHSFHGVHPSTIYPVIQGHEIAGEVDRVGKDVEGFTKGDRVTILPQITCGKCYPCINGMYHICDNLKVMGFHTDGAAQEYFVVPESLAIKLPGDISIDIAATVEPVSVAVHALEKAPDIDNKNVLVIGSGPIGNLVGQVARSYGARSVMNVDISNFRLELARRCGISYTVNTQEEGLGDAILRYFGKDRADVIFECVGSETTINQTATVARKGSTIVVVGVFGEIPSFNMGLVQDHELNLIGTLMYQKKDFLRSIELINAGKLNIEELITNSFPFDAYLEAYHFIEKSKDRAMKVLVSLD